MAEPKFALVLSGGGARAAYQVGVLAGIASFRPPHTPNPFAIICGTSAGAINATAIASGAQRFAIACGRLRELWWRLHVEDVYRADAPMVLRTGARWLASLLPGLAHRRPASLLDNSPLAALLKREIPFPAIRANIAAGHLDALTITAASYVTGLSVSFCAARPDIVLWKRAQRVGVAAELDVIHLLASSAIPLVFPAVTIDGEHFGDGAIRQVAPTAPALHLGADRILVIGAARVATQPDAHATSKVPSLAQIGGSVLASIFTDALGTDLEKVNLINAAVRQIPADRLQHSPIPLRDVRLMVMTPSVPLESLALAHLNELPRTLRMLLSRVGATGEGGSGLLSYLLFEPGYTHALIDLGWRDAHARRAAFDEFFRH